MTSTLQRTADDLLNKLTPGERVELADVLYASLPDEYRERVEATWEREIDRRLDEVESGRAVLHSAEEVHTRVRAAIDEARRSTPSRHQ